MKRGEGHSDPVIGWGMSKKLKNQWLTWLVVALVVAVGAIAFRVSTVGTEIPLTLVSREGVDFTIFRLFPHRIFPTLFFQRPASDQTKRSIWEWRPELGNTQNDIEKGRQKGGAYFLNPGAAVTVRVSIRETGKDVVLRAEPASLFGPTIGRNLVPSGGEADPHLFLRTQGLDEWPILPIGISHVRVSVLQVEEPLIAEQVSFAVEPPITLKGVAKSYVPLLLFWPWPLYAVVVAFWGMLLLVKTRKGRR